MDTPEDVFQRALRSIDADLAEEGFPQEIKEYYKRMMTAVYPAFCAALETERQLGSSPGHVSMCVTGIICKMIREVSITYCINDLDIPSMMRIHAEGIAFCIVDDIKNEVWKDHLEAAKHLN